MDILLYLPEPDNYLTADEIREKWGVFNSPYFMSIQVFTYLLAITTVVPKFMKNRKAYNLRYFIICYDLVQIYLNWYLIQHAFLDYGDHTLQFLTHNYCNKVIDSPFFYSKMVQGQYLFTSIKFLDLIDTVLFQLTKRNNQVTFLHVFHHLATAISAWYCCIVDASALSLLFGLMNSLIHVLMYTYYLIAAMGPEYKKFIWWKKYLTNLQIAQFVIIVGFCVYSLINKCDMSPQVSKLICTITFVVLILFINFYIKTYIKKSGKKRNV